MAARHATAHAAHRAAGWTLRPVRLDWRPGLVLLVATAFVAGAVTQTTWSQLEADAARAERVTAAEAADRAEEATRRRVEAATVSRLSGQATAYLAHRRTEALAVATGAVLAGEVLATSADVLPAAQAAELDAALVELSALVARIPDADTALDEAAAVAAEAPPAADPAAVPDLPTASPVLPVAPLGDAVELVRADEAGAEPVGAASAGTESVGAANASAEPVGADEAGAEPGGADEAGAEPGHTAPPTPLAKAVPVEPPAPSMVLDLVDLDLADSQALLTAAQRVLELSAEAEATVVAVRAAEEAAARAQAIRDADQARIRELSAAADSYPNGQIPERYLCGVEFDADVLLRCDAARALTTLNAAYRAETGRDLQVVSSYRTATRQAELHEEKGDLAAPAGASNHGRGIAVDVAGAGDLGQFDAPLYRWLSAHAGEHGWVHPPYMEPGGSGPLEPWHWEFAGE